MMLSRRSFLSATPIAVMAAPQIAQALPAPMPVLHGDEFRGIWKAVQAVGDAFKWNDTIVLADLYERAQEAIVEVVGVRAPFIVRRDIGDVIIHAPALFNLRGWPHAYSVVDEEDLFVPAVVSEFTPEAWDNLHAQSEKSWDRDKIGIRGRELTSPHRIGWQLCARTTDNDGLWI